MIESIIVWIVLAFLALIAIAMVSHHLRGGRPDERAIAAMADPVRGTLLVTSISVATPDAVHQSARIAGVISAEGIEPTAVEFRGLVATRLWPRPGARLPAIVDRADPRKFEIAWNELPGASDEAATIAAKMRDGQDEAAPGGDVSPR